jgi:hypothetical protein
MGIGKFVARETHLSCPRCGKTRRCDDLRRLVPFKGKFFMSASPCIFAA